MTYIITFLAIFGTIAFLTRYLVRQHVERQLEDLVTNNLVVQGVVLEQWDKYSNTILTVGLLILTLLGIDKTFGEDVYSQVDQLVRYVDGAIGVILVISQLAKDQFKKVAVTCLMLGSFNCVDAQMYQHKDGKFYNEPEMNAEKWADDLIAQYERSHSIKVQGGGENLKKILQWAWDKRLSKQEKNIYNIGAKFLNDYAQSEVIIPFK